MSIIVLTNPGPYRYGPGYGHVRGFTWVHVGGSQTNRPSPQGGVLGTSDYAPAVARIGYERETVRTGETNEKTKYI